MPRDRAAQNAYQRERYRKKQMETKGAVRHNSPDRSIKGRIEYWGCYTGDCIVWTGKLSNKGYGVIQVNKKNAPAHRVAYELVRGAIPDGLEIDHLCRNRACINAAHLEAVTHSVNVLRGESPVAKIGLRTHCKNGHEFNPQNARFRFRRGYLCRDCISCARALDRMRNKKRKTVVSKEKMREYRARWKAKKMQAQA